MKVNHKLKYRRIYIDTNVLSGILSSMARKKVPYSRN